MLHHPNFEKQFFMNCDASDLSLGSVLYQEDQEGNHQVISFASRTLNKCERNYHTTEKELLSIVFACEKFRTFILGYPITVRTDHKSISFLKNCRLKHGRLTRWTLTLQEYNIQWEYIPGKSNIAADVLSRVNIIAQTFEGEKETIAKVYHILKNKSELTNILSDIKIHQNKDPKISQIIQRLAENDEKIIQYYCTHNQIIFTKTNQSSEPVSYTHLDILYGTGSGNHHR